MTSYRKKEGRMRLTVLGYRTDLPIRSTQLNCPSIHLSVCSFVYLLAPLYICLFVCLSVCLVVVLYVTMFVPFSVYLFIRLSIFNMIVFCLLHLLSISLSVCPFVPFVPLSDRLFIRLFVCFASSVSPFVPISVCLPVCPLFHSSVTICPQEIRARKR